MDTVLEIVGQPPFKRLGIDTRLNGTAEAAWNRGDVATLVVSSTLGLSPSIVAVAGEAPGSGAIDATYTQRDGGVNVRTLALNLPSSQLTGHGHLARYPSTSPMGLAWICIPETLVTSIRSCAIWALSGRSHGVAALPVSLSGQAGFHGLWTGSLVAPRLAGAVNASQVGVELPASFSKGDQPRLLKFDSVAAEGSYSADRIVIQRGQLQRGAEQLVVDGSLIASEVGQMPGAAHGGMEFEYDSHSTLHLHLRATKVDTADVLPLAKLDLPVTGVLDAQITADGPLNALNGSGWAQLNDAVVYGQAVTDLRAQGSVNRPAVKLTSISLHTPAGGFRIRHIRFA